MQGAEPSRRDDLESLALMLLFIGNGAWLPWDTDHKTWDLTRIKASRQDDAFPRVLAATLRAEPAHLVHRDNPVGASCVALIHYARSLGFEDAPDFKLACKLWLDARPPLEPRPLEEQCLPPPRMSIFYIYLLFLGLLWLFTK